MGQRGWISQETSETFWILCLIIWSWSKTVIRGENIMPPQIVFLLMAKATEILNYFGHIKQFEKTTAASTLCNIFILVSKLKYAKKSYTAWVCMYVYFFGKQYSYYVDVLLSAQTCSSRRVAIKLLILISKLYNLTYLVECLESEEVLASMAFTFNRSP